jgi:hypothetical protein
MRMKLIGLRFLTVAKPGYQAGAKPDAKFGGAVSGTGRELLLPYGHRN